MLLSYNHDFLAGIVAYFYNVNTWFKTAVVYTASFYIEYVYFAIIATFYNNFAINASDFDIFHIIIGYGSGIATATTAATADDA